MAVPELTRNVGIQLNERVLLRRAARILPSLAVAQELTDRIMVIELSVLFAVVALMGAVIVKVYEWRQDVLCGLDRARDRGRPNRRHGSRR